MRTRAAASSIASGSPSSRAQIPLTASVLASVSVKSARAARARSANSAIASVSSPSGGTAYSFSP